MFTISALLPRKILSRKDAKYAKFFGALTAGQKKVERPEHSGRS